MQAPPSCCTKSTFCKYLMSLCVCGLQHIMCYECINTEIMGGTQKTYQNPHLSSWQRVRISSAAICEAATAPPAANVGEISINPALARVAAP